MTSDELEKLIERQKYLSEWLAHNRNAQAMLPYVQQQLDLTELQIRALRDLPEEAQDISLHGLATTLDHENAHIRAVLPAMPFYDPQKLKGTTDMTTAGSSTNLTSVIVRAGAIDTPRTRQYADTYFHEYQTLQEAQSRPEQVRNLLEAFDNKSTRQRFDVAHNAYIAATSGTANSSAAASEIRNLLYGVNGELYRLARKTTEENMNWSRMVHRLAKGDYEKAVLTKREKLGLLLLDQLSNMAKDRRPKLATNLSRLWPQVLDHIYILLTMTKPPSGPDRA